MPANLDNDGELRVATNQYGTDVGIKASIKDNRLVLSFYSENGIWECTMHPSEAWLFASDIISGAMELDPGYIEDLIKESIEKYQAGDY